MAMALWCCAALQCDAEGLPVGQYEDQTVLWGPRGHMTVAAVAMELVNPRTAKCVEDLVGDLPAGAAWPDEVKREKPSYHWSKPLHYTNTQPWASDYKESDCAHGRCVVTAISNYTARLADGTLPRPQRAEALKFLSHFVGDIHQPLHVGFARDRGGNEIKGKFMGHDTNLHEVWDFHVINRLLSSSYPQTGISGLARHLAAQHRNHRSSAAEHTRCDAESVSACPMAWAVEAAVLASSVGYKDKHGEVIRDGFHFTQADEEFLLPIIQNQITKGGVRLARILDRHVGSCEGIVQPNKGEYEDAIGFSVNSEEPAFSAESEEDAFVEQRRPPFLR